MEKTTKKNKVLNIIVNVLLIAAILLGIFCSFTAFVTKSGSGVPSLFGIRPFAIQTESMEPFFMKGDLIVDTVVKDPASLEVGDVITFWTVIQGKRALNTHRIIEINNYENYLSFTTKGDNNTMEDSMTVHQSEIVGKYAFRIPAVGSFIDFLQTPMGFGIVIVLPCALFFLYQLVAFFRALFAYQSEKMRVQLQQQMAAQMNVQPAAPAEASVAEAPAKGTPDEEASTETPVQETPAEEAPAEEAPAEETPAEETPAEEAPAEEAPAEEAPAEEAPAEETPAEEAPAEEAPAGVGEEGKEA